MCSGTSRKCPDNVDINRAATMTPAIGKEPAAAPVQCVVRRAVELDMPNKVYSLSRPEVAVGQVWRNPKTGVEYIVESDRGEKAVGVDVLLVPICVPEGKKARKSWKWSRAVRAEFDFVR